MEKILVVEDEEKIARFIELELQYEGYEVEKAFDGRDGLELLKTRLYDLVLLDVMLPGLNGIEVLRRLRHFSDVPVILLTARDTVIDKVSGLDGGADDYVTKPFAIEEVLARIRALLRKRKAKKGIGTNDGVRVTGSSDSSLTGLSKANNVTTGSTFSIGSAERDTTETTSKTDTTELSAGPLRLSSEKRAVWIKGNPVELTKREFDLLEHLLINKNIVITRDILLQKVWGYDFSGETNAVDVYIRYLRAKIEEPYTLKIIQTVRGVGYVIKDE